MGTPIRIAAVVPTRNREDLAIEAVRSLLAQECGIQIFLSDNSAQPRGLAEYCERTAGVTYLRPERELSMPEHWDWALARAVERSDATHFTVHYDRKISKPGAWQDMARLAGTRPDQLITYPSDFVAIDPPPRRLWQTPWTGKAFSVDTARVAELLAGGEIAAISHALPVLSNCLVPRRVLGSIVDRFGSICNSTGPDSAFMWRFLALHDRYIHNDRPQAILYASHRSNGHGYLSGKGGDFSDFLRTFGDRPWLYAAPVPGINLGQNMLYHEHELVRRATGDRLPELDRAAVLDDLAAYLRWIAVPGLKDELRQTLREHGWTGTEPEPLPRRRRRDMVMEKLARWRMWWRGEEPTNICGFAFRSDRQALHYALRYPRQPQEGHDHLARFAPTELQP